jgi:hypothetical protein
MRRAWGEVCAFVFERQRGDGMWFGCEGMFLVVICIEQVQEGEQDEDSAPSVSDCEKEEEREGGGFCRYHRKIDDRENKDRLEWKGEVSVDIRDM